MNSKSTNNFNIYYDNTPYEFGCKRIPDDDVIGCKVLPIDYDSCITFS